MSSQLKFYRKNLIDLDRVTAVTFEITDATASNKGASFIDFVRNRSNNSGWITTGSNDAANTTIEMTFDGVISIDTLILVKHNLKAYSIQYRNESDLSWTDFSTAVNVTGNSKNTTFHDFNSVNTTKIKLIITGAQVVDADKIISQIIVTRKILSGSFEGWPVLKKATVDLSKKAITTISGKAKILQRVGAYSVTMDFAVWPSNEDLDLVESLHFSNPSGFLFWPSAGNEEQFRYKRIGFRDEDIFLCGVSSEWQPEWEQGIYVNGMNMRVSLVEII